MNPKTIRGFARANSESPRVAAWGFTIGAAGELNIGGLSAEGLAREYGTPLHVIDERAVGSRGRRIAAAFSAAYPGASRVHFAMKANDTPAVVALVTEAGLALEVGSPYEWWLARRLGMPPSDLVVNGPNKASLLEIALREGAGLVVLDGLDELDATAVLARQLGVEPRVLLRVNPDSVPRGMNIATATGSRRRSVFGLDLAGGEVDEAFAHLSRGGPLRYAGLHCHVGSGIYRPGDYGVPVERLVACAARARRYGLVTEVLDVGGGIGVATSREMTTREYLTYHAFGRLPALTDPGAFPPVEAFAAAIANAVTSGCERHELPLPRLLVEPGRAVVSSAGALLVSVCRLKRRSGVGTWAVTDGGAGTVAFPLFYELHAVLRCREPEAAAVQRYDLVGGACFSADWVYRGKRLPELRVGDVLAICDAGAYFTVQESSFGFPHPAIVSVRDGHARLLRRRETFDEMVGRDVVPWSATTEPIAIEEPEVRAAPPSSDFRFRCLALADRKEAVALLDRGFEGHDLYRSALGLGRMTFREYFELLIDLAFADDRGLVFGAEHDGALVAVLIASRPGFPSLSPGLRHVRDFARVAGWRGALRYLWFDFGLERLLRRPRHERQREVRGLWLAADATHTGRRAGGFLVRSACEHARRTGYSLQAACVDAGDRRLVAFYTRLGFRVAATPSFLGGRAVRMERDSNQL
jgi:diaminopimelate decarboxylase